MIMNLMLHDIRLFQSHFSLNEQMLEEGREYSIERELTIAVNYDSQKKRLKVDLRIRNKNEDSPFFFDIVYQGFFELSCDKPPEELEVDRIGAVNCAAIIFPFAREHLAELTRKAGLPPFMLPPVNFVKEYQHRSMK